MYVVLRLIRSNYVTINDGATRTKLGGLNPSALSQSPQAHQLRVYNDARRYFGAVQLLHNLKCTLGALTSDDMRQLLTCTSHTGSIRTPEDLIGVHLDFKLPPILLHALLKFCGSNTGGEGADDEANECQRG